MNDAEPPIPKYFSKKILSLLIIPCFFSVRLPLPNRETGGISLSMSVPAVLISPSRNAASLLIISLSYIQLSCCLCEPPLIIDALAAFGNSPPYWGVSRLIIQIHSLLTVDVERVICSFSVWSATVHCLQQTWMPCCSGHHAELYLP